MAWIPGGGCYKTLFKHLDKGNLRFAEITYKTIPLDSDSTFRIRIYGDIWYHIIGGSYWHGLGNDNVKRMDMSYQALEKILQ